jgi:hypothetical protein
MASLPLMTVDDTGKPLARKDCANCADTAHEKWHDYGEAAAAREWQGLLGGQAFSVMGASRRAMGLADRATEANRPDTTGMPRIASALAV